MNLARLNHILIPDTKEGRDRLRHGRLGRLARPIGRAYLALSDEGRVLVGLICPVVGVASLAVDSTQTYVLFCALLAPILASLHLRGRAALPDVELHVEGPRRVIVGEPTRFELVVDNRGTERHLGLRVGRPLLPWDGSYRGAAPSLDELGPGERVRLAIPARFVARGEHHLDRFWLQALVPMGLALGPARWSDGPRFLVVPRPAAIKTLRLPTGVRAQDSGAQLASRAGESFELVGVRGYRRGDRVRDLHARSWARTGRPHVREYRQETATRVAVVVDTDVAHADERRFEGALSLAAGVVGHLSRRDVSVDVLACGMEANPLRGVRGGGLLDEALAHLACVEHGGPLDPEALVAALAPHLEHLACAVFVALAADDARLRVAELLRGRGIPTRLLVVVPPGSAWDGREATLVPVDVVESSPELLL